jgi:hypothetical protein
MKEAEPELRIFVAVLGGAPIPGQGILVALRHADAVLVHFAELVGRSRITLLRRHPVIASRLMQVFRTGVLPISVYLRRAIPVPSDFGWAVFGSGRKRHEQAADCES